MEANQGVSVNVEDFEQRLGKCKSAMERLVNLCRALLIDAAWAKYERRIKSLLNAVTFVYNTRIADAALLVRELAAANNALLHPIPQTRVILLGKTRSGKSTFGNVMTSSTTFRVIDSTQSTTKEHTVSPSTFDGFSVDFVDTQGLDDTDNPGEVIPKLKTMIVDIKWQYHAVCYCLKFDAMTATTVLAIRNFLQDLMGLDVLERTILVITNCPSAWRFQNFDESRRILLQDVQANPELYKALQHFPHVKCVDFPGVDKMDDDEREIALKKRERERGIFFQELRQRHFSLANTLPLKLYVLRYLNLTSDTMSKLEKLCSDMYEKHRILQDKDQWSLFWGSFAQSFGISEKDDFYDDWFAHLKEKWSL